ncbi:MAG TPA: hypothetical protein VHZ51_14595 [Ktedonobacteraceae bacterium]|jgi:hypothetical protein|nr:hypothetical protein [Ktedonobacteraceae bacterium]
MQQQTMAHQHAPKAPTRRERPKRLDIFLHLFKTCALIGALLKDRRISLVRKSLFVLSIGVLLLVLFFPDFFNEAFMSVIMPLIGTVLGVPIDAGFDWIAFSLLLVSLLRFFPPDLVAEHYQHIFHK